MNDNPRPALYRATADASTAGSHSTVRRCLGTLVALLAFGAALLVMNCTPIVSRTPFNGSTAPQTASSSANQAGDAPVLLEEGYVGYNIVRFRGQLFGLPQSAGPFRTDAAASGVYLTAPTLELLHDIIDNTPSLMEENYAGYNIVGYRGQLYALPQAAGSFLPDAAVNGAYLQASTLALMRETIARAVLAARDRDADRFPQVPALLWTNYHLFNLYRYRAHTYAVPRAGPGFTLAGAAAGDFMAADESSTVIAQIEDRGPAQLEVLADADSTTPHLIEEGVNGYNIVRYNLRTYAIRDNDGPFDAVRFDDGGFNGGLVSPSWSEVRARILAPNVDGTPILAAATPASTSQETSDVAPLENQTVRADSELPSITVQPSTRTPEPATTQDSIAEQSTAVPALGSLTPGAVGRPAKVMVRTNLRRSASGPVIRVLPQFETVFINGDAELADGYSWVPVRTSDGAYGWVVVGVLSY